eukprot:m.61138 g.61138  ORF g.61138 m.61138 type:complete len:224 (+) comp15754_c1_seq2:1819-2490(+)
MASTSNKFHTYVDLAPITPHVLDDRSPETYELSKVPNQNSEKTHADFGFGPQIIGVDCGDSALQLFPGAIKALQDVHDGVFPGLKCAVASTANETRSAKIAHAALDILEIKPGITVREVLSLGWERGFDGHVQIGRAPPLANDKSKAHFPRLRDATQIAFERMLFFDDCNWEDHCANVAAACPGVIVQRTPHGLSDVEWRRGLEKFRESVSVATKDGTIHRAD